MNLSLKKPFISKVKTTPLLIILLSILIFVDSFDCLRSALQKGYYTNQDPAQNFFFRPYHLFFVAFFGFATAIGVFKMKRWSFFLLLLLILINQSILFSVGIYSILELFVSLVPLTILGYYYKRMT